MRRLIFLVALACLTASAAAEEPTNVVPGNTQFALDMYAKLRDMPGNQFCSPYSISAALAMTSRGARGETLKEMMNVLHLPADASAGFAQLDAKLMRKDPKTGLEVSIANALWGQKAFPFKQEFLDALQKDYKAGMRELDFANVSAAVKTINTWVEEQTHDRIKDLLSAGDISPTCRLVLTNAIYFKGQWSHQFSKSLTKDEPFKLADGTTVTAKLMHQTERFRYLEADGMQLLEMPYNGSTLAMTLLLPSTVDGLPAIEKKLTPDQVKNWLASAKAKKGAIAIPKFQFDKSYQVADVLQSMGMKTPFSDSADFSGMCSAERLKIDRVIHKAFVKNDEEGSEAAAATAVTMKRAGAPAQEETPFQFRADHPFLVMIRDTDTGSILFMGRLSEPKDK